MEGKRMARVTTAIFALAVAIAAGGGGLLVGAQSTSCAEKLTQCGNFLNSNSTTPPPETCCGPLREAVTNDMTCLCSILTNPEISRAFHISTENAFKLARSCNVSNMNGCSTAPTPSITPPGGSGGGGNNAAAAYRMNSIALMGFLLFLWFTMA